VPVTVWVTDPDSKTGSKFRSLTLNEAEDAPGVPVVAPIVTEWPAMIVDTGVYMPEVDMGPVEAVPPTTPLTDHTAGVGTPATRALYCALPPNLIRSGPLIDSCAEAWVSRPIQQAAGSNRSNARNIRRGWLRSRIEGLALIGIGPRFASRKWA
jgi:hypothetical protein